MLKKLREKRAKLLREAEALKGRDGQFATDEARASFDEKMTAIEALDQEIREAEGSVARRSATLVERDPLDPGAPARRTGGGDPDPDPDPDPKPEPNDTERGVTAERARCQGITSACRAARLPQSVADKLIADGISLVAAQTRVFDEMSRRGGDTLGPARGPSNIQVDGDPLVHVRAGIENALLHRVAPQFFKLEPVGQNYRGLTLLDTAKLYLQARGERVTSLSRMEIAALAMGLRGGMHSTSDFPYLLADVASKTLRRAYDEAPVTYTPLVRTTTVPDFKTVNRVQLGDAPALERVREHGEFKRGTISEGKESYAIGTWGKIFAITRQALINDDTAAFTRVPTMFGRSVRTLESDLVWEQITSNPVMGDGERLFSTAHGNLAVDDGAIGVDTLSAGRAAMRKQTGLDGQRMNVSARYLLVSADEETNADKIVTPLLATQSEEANPFRGRLTVISEPRLDDVSPEAWYLAASPDQLDIIELAFLDGQDGPMVESRIGFDVDGLEIKCRHDVAAKVLDWRGLYKNEGDT